MRPKRQQPTGPVVWLLLAGVSFLMAALAAFGVILSNDAVGRLIFATAWGAIGIAWTGRYLVWRRQIDHKATSPEASKDGEARRA